MTIFQDKKISTVTPFLSTLRSAQGTLVTTIVNKGVYDCRTCPKGCEQGGERS